MAKVSIKSINMPYFLHFDSELSLVELLNFLVNFYQEICTGTFSLEGMSTSTLFKPESYWVFDMVLDSDGSVEIEVFAKAPEWTESAMTYDYDEHGNPYFYHYLGCISTKWPPQFVTQAINNMAVVAQDLPA